MSRAGAHSTGPGVTRQHVETRWTQSPPLVSEGGDHTRQPRLLRPRTELQHTLPSVNDLCPVLILLERVQEAEVHPVTRRHQGASEPQGGANSRAGGNGPQFPPCARLPKRLYVNHVSNNHPLLFSLFFHTVLKNVFVCGLVSLQEGKPCKVPIFCGLRQGPQEGDRRGGAGRWASTEKWWGPRNLQGLLTCTSHQSWAWNPPEA